MKFDLADMIGAILITIGVVLHVLGYGDNDRKSHVPALLFALGFGLIFWPQLVSAVAYFVG